MTLNHGEDPVNVEYLFIAITPMSILTQSGYTC